MGFQDAEHRVRLGRGTPRLRLLGGRELTTPRDASAALEGAARDEGGRILATLIRHLGGDFDLAEEALQDAYIAAAGAWRRDGVPINPGAWLTTAARRKAIDRLRRRKALDTRVKTLEALGAREGEGEDMDTELTDDRLRLIFTACHPALSPEARIALTLKCLGGLTTAEVAAAFLVPETTMAARITRAKHKISAARIPYRVPPDEQLPDRLSGVLTVLYLVFNEGYSATPVRGELVDEAIRLTRLLHGLMPDEPEVDGLLALMLLHDSRRHSRTAADGSLVTLDVQDRAAWDTELIAEGKRLIDAALLRRQPGAFQVEAAIAALHATAPTAQDTDWPQIAALYAVLPQTPVVMVNRAVAVGFSEGPDAGLAILDRVETLEDYAPFQLARAELLRAQVEARRAGSLQNR